MLYRVSRIFSLVAVAMPLSHSVIKVKIFFFVPFDCYTLMMLRMIFSAFCMCTFRSWMASPLVLTFLSIF